MERPTLTEKRFSDAYDWTDQTGEYQGEISVGITVNIQQWQEARTPSYLRKGLSNNSRCDSS